MRLAPELSVVAAVASFALIGSPAAASPVPLKIDAEHSSVGFSVRHLFTRVQGTFKSFEGMLAFDEADPASSTVAVTIHAASIDTNVEARDKDLRSPRFFEVEKFPNLAFEGKSVTRLSPTRFRIVGPLTMHGVTKDVALEAEFLGKGKDPWGNLRYGFHATTSVNRKDFGMQWNEVLETGGVLVGDNVDITLDVEAVPKE